ncbi:MAG: hypothetical protein F6K04_21400, partial [Leptolyngbya sp. SIO4C5]|nr:hypothetical protein [Leptolyngbya sp. SIO4C5]
MKLLRQLINQVDRQWQLALGKTPKQSLSGFLKQTPQAAKNYGQVLKLLTAPNATAADVVSRTAARRIAARRRYKRKQGGHPRVAFALAVISLTVVFGQRFYDQPQLQVGTQSPQTFIAPSAANVINEQATAERERDARNGALPVLMINQDATTAALKTLDGLLATGSQLREQTGRLPFVPTHILSTATQRYIRRADRAEWQAFWRLFQQTNSLPSASTAITAPNLQPLETQSDRLSPIQQQAFRELLAYKQRATVPEVSALETTIERARESYQQVLADLQNRSKQEAAPESAFAFSENLLDLSDPEWRSLQRLVRQVGERMLRQGIAPGLPDELIENAIRLQVGNSLPLETETIATQILMASLSPNLVTDLEQTRIQAEQVAQNVDPVTVPIDAGEVIVREGEPITQDDF